MNDTTNNPIETGDERIPVTVRLLPETLKRLDAIRGKRSRQHMIAGSVNALLDNIFDVPVERPKEPKAVPLKGAAA